MLQEILILLIFLIALAFIARMFYRQFFTKNNPGCVSSGCSGCSSINFDKIRADIEKAKVRNQ